MLSSLVFRAVRDTLPDNPAAQERIIGASLFAMAVADVSVLSHRYRYRHNLMEFFVLGYTVRRSRSR